MVIFVEAGAYPPVRGMLLNPMEAVALYAMLVVFVVKCHGCRLLLVLPLNWYCTLSSIFTCRYYNTKCWLLTCAVFHLSTVSIGYGPRVSQFLIILSAA